MAENDVDNELLDYEDDEVENAAGADGAEAPPKKDVKGSYVSIHSSGFRDFLLKPELLRAIVDCGFEHPSEVQHECIPHGMVAVFFGGLSIKKDEEVLKKNCPHIVVGTPGRILALARNKSLNLKHIKHFILDECDKMLEQLGGSGVVIFVKSVQRCIALAQLLVEQNFPAIAIHRGMPQEERLSRYQPGRGLGTDCAAGRGGEEERGGEGAAGLGEIKAIFVAEMAPWFLWGRQGARGAGGGASAAVT
ncbi:PREDICTED: spliceosome RNA helicase DDX39B-like [Sturnus vulgaris]|uniref:spliceosome RNA helicase DDX39B-like n=1 Tax=Sturnus vulgaris TaxID=9172 RepID=UPI00071A2094|nr:PREDICTED: spliceosome RNA helicase DDX39B-like [Sturnus vulgaris]